MMRSLRERLPDADERTVPIDRRQEGYLLVLGLPVLALFGTVWFDQAWPLIDRGWAVVALGGVCGLCYAVYYREFLLKWLPEDGGGGWTLVSMFGGGFGVTTLLDLLPITAATILFVLAAGSTVLSLYLLWYLSPFHDDFEPAPRGAEPPPAVDSTR